MPSRGTARALERLTGVRGRLPEVSDDALAPGEALGQQTVSDPPQTVLHPIDRQPVTGRWVLRALGQIRAERILVLYLIAIAEAEVITALVNPELGVLAHLAILANLLIHGTLARRSWDRALYLSLSIGPLTRVVSLGMPLGIFPQQWWYALSSIPLFAASYMLVRNLTLPRRQIGLQLPRLRHWPLTVLVSASGFGLGYVEFTILNPRPLVPSMALGEVALPILILMIGTGVVEELIFRGILQHTAAEVFGTRTGIVYVSALFAVLHTGHLSALDVLFVFGVAVYFAAVVHRTRSIVGVSIAHGLTNVALFIVFPLVLR